MEMLRLHKSIIGLGLYFLLGASLAYILGVPRWACLGILAIGGYLVGWGYAGVRISRRQYKQGDLKLQGGSVLGCQSPRVLYQSPDYERYVEKAQEYFK
jgi:hypothetical protein